jgi:UDP-N-acetylglucosamine:LPS N-acetylglucosamine transferase
VDRKIVVYGGGQGSTYYDSVYVLDTVTRRWSRPAVAGVKPPPRRAHTGVLYHGKIYMFGGGNGMTALNDVWTLDVTNVAKMRWEELQTTGRKPSHRGYHTANLIGNVMIVVGGSDGKDCFNDIWCLNLGQCARSCRSVALTEMGCRHAAVDETARRHAAPPPLAHVDAGRLIPLHYRRARRHALPLRPSPL